MLTTELPTAREKRFDVFIRRSIKDGINNYKNTAVYIENNQQRMLELYSLLHRAVPAEKIETNIRLIYENERSYAITDELLYRSLKLLSGMERKLILKYYWDNVKLFSMASRMSIPMTVLQKSLYAAVDNLAEILTAQEA